MQFSTENMADLSFSSLQHSFFNSMRIVESCS